MLLTIIMVKHIASQKFPLSDRLMLKDFYMVGSPELSTAWFVHSSVKYMRTFHCRDTTGLKFLVKINKIFQGSRKDATL